jgi:addiction module RelE/StbE family toxin
MFSLVTPPQFLRQARRFFKKHPDLRPSFTQLLEDLQRDPFQPHLGLHPLTGKLAGCHAVSLTYSYRVTLTLLITEQEIVLLDIGSHHEVYH